LKLVIRNLSRHFFNLGGRDPVYPAKCGGYGGDNLDIVFHVFCVIPKLSPPQRDPAHYKYNKVAGPITPASPSEAGRANFKLLFSR